ncbi:hypothetical protein ACXR0O_07350 [Verrucomicrobiota bacterium sgz303538]
MFPLSRAGLLFGTVGFLAIGFAVGWSCATLHEPAVTANPTQKSSGAAERPQSAFGAVTANAAMLSESSSSDKTTSSLSAANDPVPVGSFSDSVRAAVKLGDYTDRLIRIREIVRTLSVDQLPDAFEQVKRLSRSERYQVLNELGRRWAELDVKGAIEFGVKSGRVSSYAGFDTFLQGAVDKWASTAPAEATAWVNAQSPGEERNSMINVILRGMGRNDPQAAVQFLRSQGASWQGGWAVDELFANWAERNPEAAIAAAAELKGNANRAALRGAARAWGQENPQAAMAWGERLTDPVARRSVIGNIVDQWADNDPLGVIAWSRNAKDQDVQRDAVSRAISQLAGRDLPTALAQIESLPAGEGRDSAVMAAANSVGRQDARAAIQLLSRLDPGPERTRAISQMCSVWAASEPRAAVEWMFQNTTPSEVGYESTNVLGRWTEKAPDEAIAWVQTLPPGDRRDAAMAGVAASLSNLDPRRAQTLFNQLSPESKASVAERFAYAMTQQDPENARAWAEALPPGKAQSTAYGVIAYQLANKDASGTAEWLGTLPAGAARDQAVVGFSNYASRRDPEAGLAWALTISDEVDRMQQVEALLKQWRSTDSGSARNWLNTNRQLTPEQKRRIQGR